MPIEDMEEEVLAKIPDLNDTRYQATPLHDMVCKEL